MEINNINQEPINSTGGQEKTKNLGNSNFKNLFIGISKQLQTVAKDFADTSKTQIEIKGEKFDKSSPGTSILLGQYMTDLQNLNQLSLDLLTKKGSFEDQASKMIS